MFDKVDVNIGNQFKQQRTIKHYSMQYMADRLGIPKSSYYYYECGRSSMAMSMFVKSCEILGLDYVQVVENAKKELR